MRNYIFIYLFATITILFADSYEVKLYENLFPKLFHKKIINIYTDDNQKYFQKSKILKLTNFNKADIVILYKSQIICNKPIFSTSYISYINSKAIGAFYWRKGRPQLILNKKMILYYHLHIDNSLKKYLK